MIGYTFRERYYGMTLRAAIASNVSVWAAIAQLAVSAPIGAQSSGPENTVALFLSMDLAGRRITPEKKGKILAMVEWTDPGLDTIVVVSGYAIRRVQRVSTRREISVDYDYVGVVTGMQFEPRLNVRKNVVFTVVPTVGGWKIADPMIPPHVSPDAAVRYLRRLAAREPERRDQIDRLIAAIQDSAAD